MRLIAELAPKGQECNAVHVEVEVTEYDEYTVIHTAKLCFNRFGEITLDLDLAENQDLVKKAFSKKCYLPLLEHEVAGYEQILAEQEYA
ncbi:hypothetical protein [Moraxella equi]|uniref:Uncharacterized protein n=1 Tax=Moraxella equi TaxID=60442 RepID=A0A378QND5_9GAMM|nr:hypothetical protein [Moraxella equi]OPH36264.1 hypothetical protein B5J93_09405 [Moraxella equi]STZ01992.1 Uncharacterised protein [Moraxella equi]